MSRAVFLIEKEKWLKFQTQCKLRNKSASSEIRKYVEESVKYDEMRTRL